MASNGGRIGGDRVCAKHQSISQRKPFGQLSHIQALSWMTTRHRSKATNFGAFLTAPGVEQKRSKLRPSSSLQSTGHLEANSDGFKNGTSTMSRQIRPRFWHCCIPFHTGTSETVYRKTSFLNEVSQALKTLFRAHRLQSSLKPTAEVHMKTIRVEDKVRTVPGGGTPPAVRWHRSSSSRSESR